MAAVLAVIAAAAPTATGATPGALDTTYGGGDGVASAGFPGAFFANGFGGAMQADDKAIVVGLVRTANGPNPGEGPGYGVVRFTQGGELDPTFSGDGRVRTVVGNGGSARTAEVQPDGRILVAGGADGNGAETPYLPRFGLVRYTSDGVLDDTFGEGGIETTEVGGNPPGSTGVTANVNDLVVLGDGKIVAAGCAFWPGGRQHMQVARYTASGDPDPTFGGGDGLVDAKPGDQSACAKGAVVQPDGKIVVAGNAYSNSLGQRVFALTRILADGSGVDATFGSGGVTLTPFPGADPNRGAEANTLIAMADGRLVAAGETQPLAGGRYAAVARYSKDGVLDPSFGDGGTKTVAIGDSPPDAVARGALEQFDGKLLLGGDGRAADGDTRAGVARLLGDGGPDPGFDGDGSAIATQDGFTQAYTLLRQGDWKLVTAGTQGSNFAAVRFGNDAPPEPPEPPPPPASTPPPDEPADPVPPGCDTIVRFANIEVRAACFRRVGSLLVSEGRVRVNGVDFTPLQAQQRIEIDEAARTLRVSQNAEVAIDLGTVRVFTGRLGLTVNLGSGFQLDVTGQRFASFALSGSAAVTWTDRSATFRVTSLVSFGTVSATGEFSMRLSSGDGLDASSVLLRVPTAVFGGFEVRDLEASYGAAGLRGRATVLAPGPAPRPTFAVDAGLGAGGVDGLSVSLEPANLRIGKILRLDKLALSIRPRPFTASGTFAGGIGARPGTSGEALAGSGTFGYVPRGSRSGAPAYVFGGKLKLLNRIELLNAWGESNLNDTARAGGRIDLNLIPPFDIPGVGKNGGLGIAGTMAGVFTPTTFSMQGGVTLNYFVLTADGNVYTSDKGYAACGSAKIGAGPIQTSVTLGVAATYATGIPKVLTGACDIGTLVTAATTAQAGGTRAVRLARGQRAAVIAVRGRQGAPRVEVRGPGGVRMSMPPTSRGGRRGRFTVIPAPQLDVTYVLVARPPGGAWRVRALPGSTPIRSVRSARVLARPSVRARVTGRGHVRRLRWALKPRRGQVVRFMEMGPDGARPIATTRRARGAKRFRLYPGRRSTRRIVAEVLQGGVPRTQLTVARFRAPAPARPAAPTRLRARRTPGGLALTWRSRRGGRHLVTVALSDGRRLQFVTAQRALTVPGVARTVTADIRVARLDRLSQPGRTARVRVRR